MYKQFELNSKPQSINKFNVNKYFVLIKQQIQLSYPLLHHFHTYLSHLPQLMSTPIQINNHLVLGYWKATTKVSVLHSNGYKIVKDLPGSQLKDCKDYSKAFEAPELINNLILQKTYKDLINTANDL